jgi:hypothetical protein
MINLTVPVPQNLPLLLNDPRPNAVAAATKVLKGGLTHRDNILELSRFWKIQVWFSEPVQIAIQHHWVVTERVEGRVTKTHITSKTENNHVFKGFFRNNALEGAPIYYKTSSTGRHGHDFEDLESKILRYEPVIQKDSRYKDDFESYEQFKAMFNPLFITENMIKSLWNSTSGQHGGQYRKSDFHHMGKVGREVLKRFMQNFKGVSNFNEKDCPGYSRNMRNPEDNFDLIEKHHSSRHPGRDITIQHTGGYDRVFYSSEFHNCANGRYGLVANKNQFLHLEDD